MNTLTRILAALSVLFISAPSSASILWDVTFTSLAYNMSTGAIGNETVSYRYDPQDLTLTATCCVLGGPSYTLDGSLLSYTFEGIASGTGGSARLWADNPSLLENSVHFAGTTASDLSAGGQTLRTPFWANPFEVSGVMSWFIPNGEGRVPLVGGEGQFVWIQDLSHYQRLTGLSAPAGGLSLQFSVSRLPEPGSLVLLATVLLSLLPPGWRATERK
jgi:hypothetical protein